MLAVDEDALTCDMAETYHVLDIWELPVEKLAVLASGLGDDSRIKTKIRGGTDLPPNMIQAYFADTITTVIYSLGKNKTTRPASLTEMMYPNTKKKEKGIVKFASGADFMKAREAILRRMDDG